MLDRVLTSIDCVACHRICFNLPVLKNVRLTEDVRSKVSAGKAIYQNSSVSRFPVTGYLQLSLPLGYKGYTEVPVSAIVDFTDFRRELIFALTGS